MIIRIVTLDVNYLVMATPATKPAPGTLTLGANTTSLVELVLAALVSPNTRRSYAKALADLEVFAAGRPLTRRRLFDWRSEMAKKLSPSAVNVRLSAARKLVHEARRAGSITGDLATQLLDIECLPRRSGRAGNWLSLEQLRKLLAAPHRRSSRGKRNYAAIALLAGCALRRFELCSLDVKTIQFRDKRWLLDPVLGKGGKSRVVPLPRWVKIAIDEWVKEAKITKGHIIRPLTLEDRRLSENAIWKIVSGAGDLVGIPNLGPHDLRRTCAKLCRDQGGKLEDIQDFLGHESIETTRLYLGSMQDYTNAVNDDLGL